MRKIFSTVMLVAAAAMTFASCQREEMNAPKETFSTTLTLNTEVEATKTYLGAGNTVLWGENESVTLFVKDSNEEPATTFKNSTATSDFNGEASASFTFELTGIAPSASYTIGGIYPASASNGIENKNAEAYKIALPATQNASVNNYDPSAFIMVLKPETEETIPSTYTASFRRAVALNKITLTGVKENISSVEITVEPSQEGLYLAGRRYVNLTTAEFGEIYYGQTNTVIVNAPYTGSSIDVWFTSWGMELKPGDKLTVKMTSATKIYTRTITADVNGIKFVEGDLNTLKVNMSSSEEEVLNNLSGKYLVAAKKGDNWALMAPTATDYINALTTSVAYTNKECASFYEVADIDDYVWTVTAMDGGYSVCSYDGKYVAFPTGGANNAVLVDSPASLSLEIDDAHKATVMVSGRVLKYNASSPRFAFYASGQTDIYFIPWVADTTPRIFVTSEHEQSIGADGGDVKFEYTLKNLSGQSLTVEENSDFVSASVVAGVVTATVSANTTTETRNATLTLKCGEAASVSVTIIQSGKPSADAPVEVTDVLTRATTGVSNGGGYSNWSGKTAQSSAVYAGQSAGANNAIQLRTTNSNSGVVTTTSGGKVKKIKVTWNSNTDSARELEVYGKNTAYSQATDLYNSNTSGTKVGVIQYSTNPTTLEISGDYQYVGLKSKSGAMYITEIQITWETMGGTGGETPVPTPTPDPDEPGTIYQFTSGDITPGGSKNTGTINGLLGYKLGSGTAAGTLNFPAGYSEITFYAVGWSSGTNKITLTNGTVNGSNSLTLTNNSVAANNFTDGFSKTVTNQDTYKYTIVVANPSQSVELSLKRGLVWGFEGVPAN